MFVVKYALEPYLTCIQLQCQIDHADQCTDTRMRNEVKFERYTDTTWQETVSIPQGMNWFKPSCFLELEFASSRYIPAVLVVLAVSNIKSKYVPSCCTSTRQYLRLFSLIGKDSLLVQGSLPLVSQTLDSSAQVLVLQKFSDAFHPSMSITF